MIFSLRPRFVSGFVSSGSSPFLQGSGPDEGTLCPLIDTRIKASVSGPFAEVELTQLFLNATVRDLEALYVFPLPHDSAVTGFEMRHEGRVISGVVRESLGARNEFEQATTAGRRAALLEQERPNVFTLTAGRIGAGDRLEICIRYVQVLPYRSGRFTFRVPLVVAPRYIPGVLEGIELDDGPGDPLVTWSTDRVPDAARISPPRASGNHGVSLELELRAGMPINEWKCPSHPVKVHEMEKDLLRVRLEPGHVPDRDFVFHYHVGGETLKTGLVAHRPDPTKPGTFCIFALPPEDIGLEDVCPRDVIFVLDRSGSMQGPKMQKAKEAVRGFLRGLNPHDAFGLVTFSDSLSVLDAQMTPFTEAGLVRAEAFLERQVADGGTELLPALERAFEVSSSSERSRHVIVITDGQVGNEAEIVRRVQLQRGNVKIHAFGIDSSVNDRFIHQLARFGRGHARLVLPSQDIEGEIAELAAHIASPLLSAPRLQLDTAEPAHLSPRQLPDLGAGDVLVVAGTFTGTGRVPFSILGEGPTGSQLFQGEVELPALTTGGREVQAIWARLRLNDLEDDLTIDPADDATRRRVIRLSIDQGLLSSCTSFVAVDSRQRRSRGEATPFTRVHVPLEMPHGWQVDPDPPATAPRPRLDDTPYSSFEHGLLNFMRGGWISSFVRMFSGPGGAGSLTGAPGGAVAPEPAPLPRRRARPEGPRGPDVTLRTLAKRQHASGAWPDGLRGTASALLALVDGGHTDRDGCFAGQIRRAVAWLEEALAGVSDAAPALDAEDRRLAARALERLAQATGSRRHRDLARRFGSSVLSPMTEESETRGGLPPPPRLREGGPG